MVDHTLNRLYIDNAVVKVFLRAPSVHHSSAQVNSFKMCTIISMVKCEVKVIMCPTEGMVFGNGDSEWFISIRSRRKVVL